MTSGTPIQASGGDGRKGADDGVENPGGKGPGGESEGGAYPDPAAGEHRGEQGFMGHGGQSHVDYSGTGDDADEDGGPDNRNAATGTD